MKNLRRVLNAVAVGLLGMACLLANTAYSAESELPKGKKWKLIWSDEFDGLKLDESKWEHHHRDMDKRRLGYIAHDAVYLDGKGHLVIKVYEKDGKYFSGIIHTKGKFEHKYGYWVARCKLPQEEGHWPAFWINDQPAKFDPDDQATEIDIMEYPTILKDRIHHNLHWFIDGKRENHQHAGHNDIMPGVSEGFHTFAVEWTPQEYVFYVDGKVTWRTDKGISHRKEFRFIRLKRMWDRKIANPGARFQNKGE